MFVIVEIYCSAGRNLPLSRIFFMLLLCDVQFHLRWRNWFSHSRKPKLIPLVIFLSSEVLLRLSCLQMSRILLGIFCVFLHACIGSSKMLLPSALEKKLVLKLGVKSTDYISRPDMKFTLVIAKKLSWKTDKPFSSIFKHLQLVSISDTLIYITQIERLTRFTIFLLRNADDIYRGARM